ncbi:MAG TPA: hypothetical protein ACFCUD_04030 [Cyclobacteriaceae bacterium]
MDPFEYVVVITSLISGLGIAQILSGLADIISHLSHIKISWPLIIMSVNTFLSLIQEWFINYHYATQVEAWSLFDVMFLLLYPTLLFILARMLFPTGLREHEEDLHEYYMDQWKWLFSISTLIITVSILHDLYFSDLQLLDQIPKLIIIAIQLAFILFNIKDYNAHTIYQSFTLIALVVFLILTDSVLVDYN